MFSRRRFLAGTPGILAALAASRAKGAEVVSPATNAAPAVQSAVPPLVGRSTRLRSWAGFQPARLAVDPSRPFRILQFTDLHFFFKTAEEDRRTILDMQGFVESLVPDLVVVSGDLWHDNPNGRGIQGLEQFLAAARRWEVPWAMCWGNHDLLEDYQVAHDAFEAAPLSAYRGGGTHGDYRVEVVSRSDPDHVTLLDLFFLNSHADGLSAWQIDALRSMLAGVEARPGSAVPALAFFHIPILEYETAMSPAGFRGVKLEEVSRGRENGAVFPVLKTRGRIRAAFCGHNHLNDYTVNAGGLSLNYGRSTGHAGYGADRMRKGAKLIEVELREFKIQISSVFADGSRQIA